jgi:multiple sugar transport system permease protein
MRENRLLQPFIYLVLSLLAFVYIIPWFYMLSRSFVRLQPGLTGIKSLFTLEYYKIILGSGGFLTYLFNSCFVLFVVLAFNIVFSLMVGYAFARYSFPFKRTLFVLVLSTLIIPKQTLMVPLLDLMVRFGLHDSLWAIILPFMVDGFNIFLMRQYIQALPKDLEDAARADGASELMLLRHVVPPLCKPALAVLIINTAIINWNSFLFPLVFIDSSSQRTLPVALAMLSKGQYATDWGVLMAGASISSLPLIIVFWFFQKQIIAGIIGGAIKE